MTQRVTTRAGGRVVVDDESLGEDEVRIEVEERSDVCLDGEPELGMETHSKETEEHLWKMTREKTSTSKLAQLYFLPKKVLDKSGL